MKANSKLVEFNVPGLGDNLFMNAKGQVYTVTPDGKPANCIAYRDEEGVWQYVMSFPINSSQLVATLENLYNNKV